MFGKHDQVRCVLAVPVSTSTAVIFCCLHFLTPIALANLPGHTYCAATIYAHCFHPHLLLWLVVTCLRCMSEAHGSGMSVMMVWAVGTYSCLGW
jgi:hypothetical protein